MWSLISVDIRINTALLLVGKYYTPWLRKISRARLHERIWIRFCIPGANLNMRDREDRTALALNDSEGYKGTTEILRRAGKTYYITTSESDLKRKNI